MTDESEADAGSGADDAGADGPDDPPDGRATSSTGEPGDGAPDGSVEPDVDDSAAEVDGDAASDDGRDGTVAAGASTDADASDATRDDADVIGSAADVEDHAAGGGGGPADAGLVDDEVLDPTEIDASELTLPERSLHPRIRVLWIVRAIAVALVAGGLAAVSTAVFDLPLYVPGGVVVAFLALGLTFAVLRYRIWRYAVREDALYLERGVVTRVRTVVPLVRIQHVDTRRGPVERLTGLATVVVFTAGSRGADVAIPGVSADRADDLQRRLKRLAIASEADTSV